MKKKTTLALLFFICSIITFGQSRFNLPRTNSDKIKFQFINNLIIVPVEVNGVSLSFLLDTGVSKPILFNIANIDTLQVNNVETVYLRGLGGGEPVEALKSKNNIFKIGNAINLNQDIFVVFDNSINFTPRLGIAVHGIIGFDLFRDFIVEINYRSKYLKLHKPESYEYKRCKKCEQFNISFYNNKPYINGTVKIETENLPVKLLIDTGSSDALWLFEEDSLGMKPLNNKYFVDFLGKGLSGSVYGKRTKVKSFNLKSFVLKDVNVAFPDSTSISYARKHEERNGSISGELLKRFNIIMDYRNARVTLKKNSNFRSPFRYNKSGIVLEQDGIRVVKEQQNVISDRQKESQGAIKIDFEVRFKYSLKPVFIIAELRKDSPAERAGLLIGDAILSINGKDTYAMKLHDLIDIFSGDEDKLVKLEVERNFKSIRVNFRLEDPLK
ncbi:aspartyl protease family protein [Flavobacteriaceae bacterium LMO-SS05]